MEPKPTSLWHGALRTLPGLILLVGVCVILFGVVLAAYAGAGRLKVGNQTGEPLLAVGIGISASLAVVRLGMGIQPAAWMQIVGFTGGEWRGVHGQRRRWLYQSTACLIIAVVVVVVGNMVALSKASAF